MTKWYWYCHWRYGNNRKPRYETQFWPDCWANLPGVYVWLNKMTGSFSIISWNLSKSWRWEISAAFKHFHTSHRQLDDPRNIYHIPSQIVDPNGTYVLCVLHINLTNNQEIGLFRLVAISINSWLFRIQEWYLKIVDSADIRHPKSMSPLSPHQPSSITGYLSLITSQSLV